MFRSLAGILALFLSLAWIASCGAGRGQGVLPGGGGGLGDDDSASGDDDTSVGDDDTSAGDDDTSVGDDDTSAGDDDTSAGDDDTAGKDCEGVKQVPGTAVTLVEVADGIQEPVFIGNAGDGTGRLFVLEQEGRIYALSPSGGGFSKSSWLDIRERVRGGGERGLLSVAFHPSFSSNGRFFVYYTDNSGDVVVSEFTVSGQPTTDTPDPASERVLLEIDQPASNHNGGQVVFGPDGYLYIGTGDGGGAGDTYGNGQNPDTLLAKILRIDVDNGEPYSIPAGNPFLTSANHRPETWAWGLRNPWRFSFDRETGQMWIADVGQNIWEEVDIGAAGTNYGWPMAEANHCFTPDCDLDAFEGAVYEYSHAQGVSITGGYVYRGCEMPDLHGVYFLSDYGFGGSPLWSLTWDGTQASKGPVWNSSTGLKISSFGEDEQGEIYIADHMGNAIFRIAPAS